VKLDVAPDGTHSGKLQVELLAYDRAGNVVNWAGGTQAMSIKPDIFEAVQKSGVPAHIEIDLPTDRDVFLETGVYDWATAKAGTVEVPLHPVSFQIDAASTDTFSTVIWASMSRNWDLFGLRQSPRSRWTAQKNRKDRRLESAPPPCGVPSLRLRDARDSAECYFFRRIGLSCSSRGVRDRRSTLA
jgi:hypothetical protein